MQERGLYRENVHVQVWKRNRDAEQRHEHSGTESCRRPRGPPHSVSTLSRQTPWSLVCTRQPAGLTDLTWRGFPISSFLIPADFSRILSSSLFYLHQSFPRLGSPCLSISNLEKCVDGLLNVLKLWSVGNARWGYGHVGAWKRQLTVGNLHRECWRNRPLSSWCLDSDWNGFQLSELFLVVFARTPHSTAI